MPRFLVALVLAGVLASFATPALALTQSTPCLTIAPNHTPGTALQIIPCSSPSPSPSPSSSSSPRPVPVLAVSPTPTVSPTVAPSSSASPAAALPAAQIQPPVTGSRSAGFPWAFVLAAMAFLALLTTMALLVIDPQAWRSAWRRLF